VQISSPVAVGLFACLQITPEYWLFAAYLQEYTGGRTGGISSSSDGKKSASGSKIKIYPVEWTVEKVKTPKCGQQKSAVPRVPTRIPCDGAE
jgi:hypothetical protein